MDTPLVSDDPSGAPDPEMVAHASSLGVLLTLPKHGSDDQLVLVFVTPDGTIAWRRPVDGFEIADGLEYPTRSTLLVHNRQLLDLSTGKLLHTYRDDATTFAGVCGTHAVVSTTDGWYTDSGPDGLWLVDDGTQVTTTKLGSNLLRSEVVDGISVTAAGLVDSLDGLVAYGPDGKRQWAIPSDVLGETGVITDGWLAVKNASGKPLLINAHTGKVGSPDDSVLRDTLLGLDPDTKITAYPNDSGNGTWLVYDDYAVRVSTSQLCD
jgi:hypothetical protein